jgi:hypothetical protein
MQITSADHPSVYSPSFTKLSPTRRLTPRRSDHHRKNYQSQAVRATPSPAIIVVLKLTDATNGALSLDFITVTNKSNFPNRHRHECRLSDDHRHQISDNVNIIHVGETTAVTLLARGTTSTRPTRAVPLHHMDSLISTLARIVHTRPERTLVASQADPHAFVPDATHPPSFVL